MHTRPHAIQTAASLLTAYWISLRQRIPFVNNKFNTNPFFGWHRRRVRAKSLSWQKILNENGMIEGEKSVAYRHPIPFNSKPNDNNDNRFSVFIFVRRTDIASAIGSCGRVRRDDGTTSLLCSHRTAFRPYRLAKFQLTTTSNKSI